MLVLTAAALVGMVAVAPIAGAVASDQPLDYATQIGDREVRAVAQLGNRVYVGGNFRWVVPQYDGSVGFAHATSGAVVASFPAVNGTVNVAVSDGSGGWYIGGTFTQIGGLSRTNVAHVNASNQVTTFDASATGTGITSVNAILPAGGSVYIGGSFQRVRGQTFPNLARVSASTGLPQAWNGTADGAVNALILSSDGNTLYAGGSFQNIGGAARSRIAGLNTSTGAASSFNPGANDAVNDFALSQDGATLYLAGAFTQVSGSTRNRLAAINLANEQLRPFNPNANDIVFDLEWAPDFTTIYACGQYTTLGGVSRRSVAALNPQNESLGSLSIPQIRGPAGAQDPGTTTRGGIVRTCTVTSDGQTLYFGGDFGYQNQTNANPIYKMAAVNPATSVTNYDWQVPVYAGPDDLRINELVWDPSGARVLIAGSFAQYGGINRPYLVAINATTGELDTGFNPQPNNWVEAIWPSPDGRLYVGGKFTRLGSVSRTRLAEIDPATGAVVTTFRNPNVNSEVFKIQTFGNDLYVTGRFSNVGGVARSRLARVDATTGAVDASFNIPATGGAVRGIDISPDGSFIFIAGDFSSVGGLTHNDIAKIHTNPPQVSNWNTDTYNTSGLGRDVDISPDGAKAYMVTAGGDRYPGGDTAAAFATEDPPGNSNVSALWINRVGDTMETVVSATDAVYVGGHLRYVDSTVGQSIPNATSKPRFQIAALDPNTGTGLAWNPGAGGFRGVLDLALGPSGLLVGSDGWQMAAEPHARIGLFPIADVTTPTTPGKPSGVSNSSSSIDLTWAASTDPDDATLTYRIYRDGGATAVGTVVSSSSTTVTFKDTGLTPGSTHTYQVDASDEANTSALSPASDPITVVGAIFTDTFDNGFQAWTSVTNLTIDQTVGGSSPPSARAEASGTRAYANHALGATYPSVCMSEAVNLSSIGANSAILMRLRTAANGAVGRAYVTSARVLMVRSDVSGQSLSSGVSLPLGTWATVELCGTVGASGTWDLYLNGTRILGPWTVNNGTTPIGLVQIGDVDLKTFTMNIDDVIVDETAG